MFQVGQLCYQVFLNLVKAGIGDLLAVRTENNISFKMAAGYHVDSDGYLASY